MKQLILILNLIMIFSNYAWSDGPPIKDGQISVPHQVIKLSKEQIKQAGAYRYIRLDGKQKEVLKKFAKSEIPDFLEIITAPYNDCACGLLFYRLWANEDEVQVPNWDLKYLSENLQYMDKIKDIPYLKNKLHHSQLNIGIEGNIYQKGKIVNNLKNALKQFNKDNRDNSVWVSTPPLKNEEAKRKAISSYINIKKFFTDIGFRVFAYFESEYITNELNGYNDLPKYTARKTDKEIEKMNNGCSFKCGSTWEMKSSSFATWKDKSYTVANLNDNSTKTAWVEGAPGHGINEGITLYNFRNRLNDTIIINGFYIYNGYIKSKELFEKNSRVRQLVFLFNGVPICLLELQDVMRAQRVIFPDILIKSDDVIELKIVDIYGGANYQDTAITLLLPCNVSDGGPVMWGFIEGQYWPGVKR